MGDEVGAGLLFVIIVGLVIVMGYFLEKGFETMGGMPRKNEGSQIEQMVNEDQFIWIGDKKYKIVLQDTKEGK